MIDRDYSDKDLRAALGSSPPLEKMKMGQKKPTPEQRAIHAVNCHDDLVKALERMEKMYGMMMEKVNHKMSYYDAETLREMNEAPIQCARALTKAKVQP